MTQSEQGQRILTELRAAVNQPLRHSSAEHPFWQELGVTHPPDKIVFATSSYRKAIYFALQFLVLNQEELPPFFREYNQDPLTFLRILKEAFHNGNGESQTEVYIGELFGVPILAQPTDGEKHQHGLTPRDEARNKATYLVKHPYQGEQNQNIWYISFDTLDRVWIKGAEGPIALGSFMKPVSWDDFPKDWQTNPEAYDEFKRRVIASYFPEGAYIEGVTFGSLVDGKGKELAIGSSIVGTQINSERLLQMIDQLDPNASAFGILQLLVDFDEAVEGDFKDKLIFDYFENASIEEQRIAAFFLLAKIIGVPASLVIELVVNAAREMKEAEMDEVMAVTSMSGPTGLGVLPAKIV